MQFVSSDLENFGKLDQEDHHRRGCTFLQRDMTLLFTNVAKTGRWPMFTKYEWNYLHCDRNAEFYQEFL